MELVNATGEDLAPQPPMPAVYKIITIVMLRNGFESGFGLGRNSQGIIKRIPSPVKGARYGFGYVPIDDEVKTKKNNDQALAICTNHFQSESTSILMASGKEFATF